MTTDTGPLVALINKRDKNYAACTAFYKTLRDPMITTWPCLTEATHLLRKAGSWSYVGDLWRFYDTGVLRVHHADESELKRVRDIMVQYHDIPCDLADASLVAAAETFGTNQIFTLDTHFFAYRMADGTAFAVKP